MTSIDSTICFVASSVFRAGGMISAIRLWDFVFSPSYRRNRLLLLFLPAALLCLWLGDGLSVGAASSGSENTAELLGRLARSGIELAAVSFVAMWIRRTIQQRRARARSPLPAGRSTTEVHGDALIAPDLLEASEQFLRSVDNGDGERVQAAYDPEFSCVRVADSGGFAQLSRSRMLAFFARESGKEGRSIGHAIPTGETMLYRAEVIGDFGFVLLTRRKDLGSGWEPMFYCLIWKRDEGQWKLVREFVHQRTVPKAL